MPNLPTDLESAANAIRDSPFAEIRGSSFYQGEVRVGNERAIILAHDAQLSLLSVQSEWFMDLTIKIRPLRSIFRQVISNHENLFIERINVTNKNLKFATVRYIFSFYPQFYFL